MDFKGKKAVVTGASSGIGRATAVLMAKEGADVAVAARNLSNLQAVKKEIEALGMKAVAIECDVTKDAGVTSMKEKALKAFGSIDILHNCAGIGLRGSLEDVSIEDWQNILDVNLMGYVRTVTAFLPYFLKRGSGYIINTSSIQAMGYGMEDLNTPYVTTKAAIIGFTECLSAYLRGRGIKVSLHIPGGVTTNIAEASVYVGSEARKQQLRDNDANFRVRPGFLTPEQCAVQLLDGVKKEQYMILTPPGMSQMLKGQGTDVDVLNEFVKNWKPRG
jgi:NAD(P)-dependent dehydrogenase (short-subunit alcohol dehydrogenase family)